MHGRHAEAVAFLRLVLARMNERGGSHVQQDVLEPRFVDAAAKSGSTDDVRLVVASIVGQRPIPPERLIGWREA